MSYPKINSLFKRRGWYFDESQKKNPEFQRTRQDFIFGDYACPEFALIKRWNVTEKVDGTNIRIVYKKICGEFQKPQILGRHEDSLTPEYVTKALEYLATEESFNKAFSLDQPSFEVILFGEGYGPKIQSAGRFYRDDIGFILFDVKIKQHHNEGISTTRSYWLKRSCVNDVAASLGIPSVPELGIMTEDEIVKFVISRPFSLCSKYPQVIEGIVARSEPQLFLRGGDPLMFKLKVKDFV